MDTAILLGLIINELVSNSIKYAFPPHPASHLRGEDKEPALSRARGEGERKGEIVIDLHSDNNKFTLNVRDNGVGLPEGLDFKNTKSLGLQLVNTLTEQIRGTIEVDRRKGTEFRISF
ncbi:MAG: sensor histidine kinase [Nitrospinae bacterium]|nr:sensor histidine kinase [Nitrospinota bacterium]MBI3815778.1 sensor histidine kinase [Nitrospinota bacterium]